MTANFTTGVFTSSSWHQLETVGVMPDADSMIEAGETSNAWPVRVAMAELVTRTNALAVPASGVVASYRSAPDTCLGVVGSRYHATTPDAWREIVRAATAAGAKPTGAFSLADGTRVCATFEVGATNGLVTQLLLVDSFDGSLNLTCGTTSIRVVCCNTLAAALSSDGAGMAKLRHTASLEEKTNRLAQNIGAAIKTGEKVRDLYHRAESTVLPATAAKAIFDTLFPEAPENASPIAKTKARSAREDAKIAARLPINRVGEKGNLATLWNAATYLVDRTFEGKARPVRGAGSMLDSMLFGSRGERVNEIQTLIEVVLRDGTIQTMTANEASSAGVDGSIVGRKVLEDMLANA